MDERRNSKPVTLGLLGFETLDALQSLGGSASGNDIWTELETLRGKRVQSGAIYTTIRRLREKGLIREAKRGVYGTTPEGVYVVDAYRSIYDQRRLKEV